MTGIRKFLQEARRRRVFRTGGLYIVGAWVLLQVGDLALESLEMPAVLLRYFWIAAFAGFPVALLFGWYYEITPDGIRKTPPGSDPDVELQMAVPDYALLAALAILVAVAAAGLFDQARQAEQLSGPYDPDAIAVLPLENLSGDDGQEYFSAGIHDALLTSLSRISGLRVISRTSSVRLDRTIGMRQIGATLGVRNIVEGSVTREGNRVRVIVQLIDAATDTHIWAQNFERDFTSVLALQNDMAKAIAKAVEIQLSADEEARLATAELVDPETYDRYLRAVYMMNQGDNRVRRRGIAILERLVEEDKADARVYASLAFGYAVLGHSPFPEGMYPASKLAVREAMRLDDSIPEVYLAAGMHDMYYEREFAAADESLNRALAINPSLVGAQYHYAWLMELYRDSERALPPGDATVELDPLSTDLRAWLAEQYRSAGQYARAIELARETLEIDEHHGIAMMSLALTLAESGDLEAALATSGKVSGHPAWGFTHGVVLAAAGREAEAREQLAAIEKHPRNVISLTLLTAALGDVDDTFHWMGVAKEMKLPWYPWMITWFPFMDSARNDPRMDVLAEELGLSDALARARGL